MFKGILAAAAVAALGFGGVLATATVSSAAVNPLQPFYHNESSVTSYLGDHMVPDRTWYNAPVDAEAVGQGYVDAFQAFSVGANLVHLSVRTDAGLSLSDPGPGAGALDELILRSTNDLGWQTFKEIPTSYPGYVALQDVRTNQFVTDNGAGVQLTGVADVGGVFDGSVNQLWKFSNNNFNHYRGRHVNPNPNPTPTVTVSPGHHHHPGPTPTATVTVTPTSTSTATATLTATEVVSNFNNGHGPGGDKAGNTVTVSNTGTSNASVTVSESAKISGTVTANVGTGNASCTYTVTGEDPSVPVTPATETVIPGTPESFTGGPVTVSTWNSLPYGTDVSITSTGSGCPVYTSVNEAVNGQILPTVVPGLQANLTNTNLTVTLTPTAVSGVTNIPVNPSSVSEVFTG